MKYDAEMERLGYIDCVCVFLHPPSSAPFRGARGHHFLMLPHENDLCWNALNVKSLENKLLEVLRLEGL